MRRGALFACLILLWSMSLSGCGPQIGSISGNISVDGLPLEAGTIQFSAAEADGGDPVTAEVRHGMYELTIVAGKKNVQISAPVVVERRPAHDGPGAEMLEFTSERLPARYNSATELSFEVQPGTNTKDWSVQSEPLQPAQ